MAEITFFIAFFAGIISFLSPCVLPLVPAFLGYLAGSHSDSRWHVFLNSVFYVLGFSLVFALIGVLLNSLLASSGIVIQTWLSRIGGIIIILFGLFMLGLLNIPFLQQEHKMNMDVKPSYVTSFLFGASFAVGWSPCVGAILGSVLTLAATQPASSFGLLLAYSLGLGIPFLLVGLFGGQFLTFLKKFPWFMKYFSIIAGVFLIILGILVFTESLNLLANFSFVNAWVLS